ncbi:YjbH domain-containing protein [Flavimaricola marinus]|uniref:Exopolysaccharide biosynthesis protein YbjH n=1 Tax=Flavimaricola marinus TaxID=1819565 RepID=A0A238LKW2_9RHOB|nr:YjbH domain-containing protein [Flavimaricola marinus]SMY10034.1 hypothetical protein LOM8899_04208 [Flavimaricola marinus]
MSNRQHIFVLGISALLCPALAPAEMRAEPQLAQGYSTFGTPGLIEMPSATLAQDGELALGLGYMNDDLQATLSFQVTPRLSASFRYTQPMSGGSSDQSLSLQYRLLDETARRPAVVIGFNDLIGCDRYRSEFIAASKTVSTDVRITAGLGWGRLAGAGSFGNPLSIFSDSFDERDSKGGTSNDDVDLSDAFRGDAAHFGGVEWQATERLRLIAEYSSLDYAASGSTGIERTSPFNFGLSYALSEALTAKAHYLYGSEVGVQFTYALDPRSPPVGQSIGSAPLPVQVRGTRPLTRPENDMQSDLSLALTSQGLSLHAIEIEGQTARVEVENRDHTVAARAIGRTARALSRTMPARVEVFDIVLVENGLRISNVRLNRGDVEALEHDLDGAWTSFIRADIGTPAYELSPVDTAYPRFDYAITPSVSASISSPESGLLADIGVDLTGRFTPSPGLQFSGTLRQKLGGTLDELTVANSGGQPQVRSNLASYAEADTTIPSLTGAYYFNAGHAEYERRCW